MHGYLCGSRPWQGHPVIRMVVLCPFTFQAASQTGCCRNSNHSRRVRKIAKSELLASSCLSVRPSARMELLGSHWKDFREI